MLSWLRVFAFFAASAAVVGHAADIRPLVKAGLDVGGDTIATAVFANGDTQKIKANEGFYVGGGAAIINDARDMEFHVSLAYKFALIDASNGDIEWTRFPLEALAFYRFARVRVGGGLTYHINPKGAFLRQRQKRRPRPDVQHELLSCARRACAR